MRSLLNPWLIRLRVLALRAAGVRIGHACEVQARTSVRHVLSRGSRGSIEIGDHAKLSRGAVIESWGGRVRLGARVFVGPYAVIYGHGGVEIGDDTLVAMHCAIVSSNHTVPPRSRMIQAEPDVLKPTRIGRDVWLGAHVTVLGGVTIGDGCIVGAGAVVTRDLPPGAIAMGVPAEVKGYRPA